MPSNKYHTKEGRLIAYYVVQQKLLGLYNQKIDIELRLREMSPIMRAAMTERGKGSFKTLERVTLETDKKLVSLKKEHPEITQSEEAKRLTDTLIRIKKEYESLSK